MHNLPETGFIRIKNIVGSPKSNPPIPPIIPISTSKLWADVKAGKFPAPVKLGLRCTAWRVEDIRRYIESVGGAS